MLSERLQNFLLSWCNPDSDLEEAAAVLHSPDGAGYRQWLPGELSAVIRAGELTPDVLERATGLYFPDQQSVDEWLHEAWAMWFGTPYPAT